MIIAGYTQRDSRAITLKIERLHAEFDEKLALYKQNFPMGVCLEDLQADPHGKDGNKLIYSSLELRLIREKIDELMNLSHRIQKQSFGI
jgi:hypothetical protein